MTSEDRSTRPPGSALPDAALPRDGGDVGGIPSTLGRGVDNASARKAARRNGTPDADGGGSAQPMARESAAVSPRLARDETTTGRPHGEAGTGGSAEDPRHSSKAGQDDSPAESIGKAISEPFKSA